jgi:hypothetical protein
LQAAILEIRRARKLIKKDSKSLSPEQIILRANHLGDKVKPLVEGDDDEEPEDKKRKIAEKKREKSKAIKARDYDRAAVLHDEIEKMEGRGGGAEQQLERMRDLQEASQYTKELKNYLEKLKPEIANAVRDGDFTRAAELKRKKDSAEKVGAIQIRYIVCTYAHSLSLLLSILVVQARAPLLHFVTRFTQNKMKAANPVDRFKKVGPPPKAEGEEGGEEEG